MSETVKRLRKLVVDDGIDENDAKFPAALRVKKIEHCQSLRGVVACAECGHVDFCKLVQEQARSVETP